MIQSPGLASRAAAPTMATMSSQVRASRRFRVILNSPRPVKWPCPSMNPGIASLPPRSITRVEGPMYLPISAFVPTASTRPPVTAIACASGWAESIVTTLPLRSTRSAGAPIAMLETKMPETRRTSRVFTSPPSLHHELVLIHHHRLPMLIQHLRVERDHAAIGPFLDLGDDLFLNMHRVADERRLGEPQPVDPVKSNHGVGGLSHLNHQTARYAQHQQPMCDAFSERPARGERFAHVQLHEVARETREVDDVRFRNGAGPGNRLVTQRKIFEI